MFSHRAVVYMSFFCFFNSIPTSTTDSTNAEKSATGPASNTPIIPKRSGSSRVSGIKKKVCLVNANRAPLNDFPIAVKKLEESNCTRSDCSGSSRCNITVTLHVESNYKSICVWIPCIVPDNNHFINCNGCCKQIHKNTTARNN